MEIIGAVLAAIVGAIVTVWATVRFGASPRSTTTIDVPITNVTRLERIRSSRRIRAGVVKYPPLCDFKRDGLRVEAAGLYPDIFRHFCDTEGLVADFVPVAWSELSSVFDRDVVDVVICVFETRLRLASGDFICKFHKIGMGAVACVGTRISSIAELKTSGVRVSVIRGGTDWEYVAEELQLPPERIVAVDNYDIHDAIGMVLAGRAEVAIADDVSCIQAIRSYSGHLVHLFAEEHIALCRNGFYVPRGDLQLREFLDRGIRVAREEPALKAAERVILDEFEGVIEEFQ
jgi:ABC-type amino acid transport substrate-binding protein